MGNAMLRGAVHCDGRRINITKADGTVMKRRGPVSVKDILIDYPNHGIFEESAGPRFGIGGFTIPLPGRAELIGGHLYYLIPLPLQLPRDELIDYNNNTHRRPFPRAFSHHSIPSACSSRLHPPSCSGIARDSIKQEEADNKMNRGGVTIVSLSYSTDGSAMRVKLRLREDELASFLSVNNVKVMVPRLIQGATRQSPWKPRALDTIAEPHNNVNVVVPPSIQGATRQSPWKPRLDTIAEPHL